ncbi:hypothetical protein LPN04_31190 [Rugamonas sp. A1-17]|nr:hypothetical protein [Rugamonas sp. A1-17]
MMAIKMNGHANPTPEDGQDVLYALSHISGFLFGYVEPKQNRVITFHDDTNPKAELEKSQVRVEIHFPSS